MELSEAARKIMREMGAKGGNAAAKALTKKQRSERARKAGSAPKRKRTNGEKP